MSKPVRYLILMAAAIVINIIIGQLAIFLKLPVFLDSIGTVSVGLLAGPWLAALTGLLSDIVWGLTGLNTQIVAFSLVGLLIGFLAGWLAQNGWFESWLRAVLAGFLTGIAALIVSTPIGRYFYGGGGAYPLWADPVDKVITFLLVWLLINKLFCWLVKKFPAANIFD